MNRSSKALSRRAFLSLSATAATGAVVMACKPAAPPPSSGTEPTVAPEATQVPAATAEPASSEPVPVIFWDMSSTEAEIENLDKAYLGFNEAQSQARVEPNHGKNDDALLAAVAAGSPPDVYWRWAVDTYGSWIYKGVIKDLTPYTQASSLDWSRFVPVALEAMKWQDKFYGMPLTSAGVGMLFWNKPMLEQAGLDPETPPTTLEDAVAWGDKMTAKDGVGSITKLGFHSNLGFLYGASLFNGRFWDPEAEKLTPTDPGVVATAEWDGKWYQHHGIEALDTFFAGMPAYWSEANPVCGDMVAMLVGFEWDWLFMTTVAGCDPAKFGMAAAPRPAGQPGNPTCSQGAIALVIPTGSAHADAGWSFIEYLQGVEPTGIICSGLINCAQIKDAVEYPAYRDNPVLKLATELSTNASFFPGYIPVAAEYSTELTKAIDLIVHGKAVAKEALQQVYDQVQPELDKALGKA